MYLLGVRVFTNTLRCSKGGMDIIHESRWIIDSGSVTVDNTEGWGGFLKMLSSVSQTATLLTLGFISFEIRYLLSQTETTFI